MDDVIDSEACTDCGHDHYPSGDVVDLCPERVDKCGEPGCDCETYLEPDTSRVYKCSTCGRMVTRVHRPIWGGGQRCDDCYFTD